MKPANFRKAGESDREYLHNLIRTGAPTGQTADPADALVPNDSTPWRSLLGVRRRYEGNAPSSIGCFYSSQKPPHFREPVSPGD
jgi:hypothetical protein